MEVFLTACGASGPILLEVEGPGLPSAARLCFSRPYVLVGRDERADLVLDHDEVSRRHAYLQVIDGQFFFVDLESRTGTTFEGVITESGWLEDGQAIMVGPYTLRPAPVAARGPSSGEDETRRVNPMLARSSEPYDLPRVSLEFQGRSSGHSVWRMNPILALVGSSSRAKVRLLDSNVSKLHCALLRTPQGLWAVDLLGRAGIMVNGTALRSAKLNPGDLLGLGQVVVRPNFEDASNPADGVQALPWSGPSRETHGSSRRLPVVRTQGHSAPPAPVPPPGPPPMPMPFPFPFPSQPMPTGTALNTSEPALAMLLGHFGQMQQQMLDQFQQQMMMMMQMFGGMHREQMGVMREELDRLRELNEEMASIKAELAARPGPAAGAGGPQAGAGQTPMASPQPQPPPQPQPQQGGSYYIGGAARGTNGQHPPADPRATAPPRPQPQATAPTFGAARPDPGPAPGPEKAEAVPPMEPVADVHDWLNERLTAITTEQQTRWQRLISLVRGGGGNP
jgi:pSer/pThr/pTyr-binding forkhead associated (FHA) protein